MYVNYPVPCFSHAGPVAQDQTELLEFIRNRLKLQAILQPVLLPCCMKFQGNGTYSYPTGNLEQTVRHLVPELQMEKKTYYTQWRRHDIFTVFKINPLGWCINHIQQMIINPCRILITLIKCIPQPRRLLKHMHQTLPSAIQISCSWLRSWKRSVKKKRLICV